MVPVIIQDYSGTGHPNGTSDDWKILLSEFDKDGNMTSINVFGGGNDKGMMLENLLM